MTVKHPFLAVDREKLKTHRFDTAEQLATFLWGKRVERYILLKDERKVVHLPQAEVAAMTRQLDAAGA